MPPTLYPIRQDLTAREEGSIRITFFSPDAEIVTWHYRPLGDDLCTEITSRERLGDNATLLTFSNDLLTLTLRSIAASAGGMYYITVGNGAGSRSGVATLTVEGSGGLISGG